MFGEEFLSTEPDTLREILSSDNLNVDREETVYEALIRWVQYKTSERSVRLPELLPAIRCSLLPTQFVREQILGNCLITENCQQCVENFECFVANPEEFHCNRNVSAACCMPRSGMLKPEHCILSIAKNVSINCYNPVTRETYHVADVHDKRSVRVPLKQVFVVTDDNQIYIAGASCIHGGTLTFFVYDSDRIKWLPRASMPFSDIYYDLAHVGGNIYCFGEILTPPIRYRPVVACYDIASDQWKQIGKMPKRLDNLKAVTYNGFIYVLGYSSTNQLSVLRFDPEHHDWTTLAAVPTPPDFCLYACVISGEIYAIGGLLSYIHVDFQTFVHIYSIEHDQWRSGPPLPDDMRVGCDTRMASEGPGGVTVVNGLMYVYGYLSGQCDERNVLYQLQQSTSTWLLLDTDPIENATLASVSALMHIHRLSQISQR